MKLSSQTLPENSAVDRMVLLLTSLGRPWCGSYSVSWDADLMFRSDESGEID